MMPVKMFRNPAVLWSEIAILALLAWLVAVVYQYVFDDAPCILCIHVRLLLTAVLIISLVGAVTTQTAWAQILTWLALLGVSGWLVERGWQLVATERGWVLGSCGLNLDLGMPSWFPVDQWMPELFEATTPCGKSPELMFGVSMAEGSLVLGGLLALIALANLIVLLIRFFRGEDIVVSKNWYSH